MEGTSVGMNDKYINGDSCQDQWMHPIHRDVMHKNHKEWHGHELHESLLAELR